jgi:hypothetical protein
MTYFDVHQLDIYDVPDGTEVSLVVACTGCEWTSGDLTNLNSAKAIKDAGCPVKAEQDRLAGRRALLVTRLARYGWGAA